MTTTEADLRVAPYRVAPETYVIPQLVHAPPIGLAYINSMVITGAEPILVNTGAPSYREQWLDHAWSLVDPQDVRWVFLTHDDHDHAGNLRQVMDMVDEAFELIRRIPELPRWEEPGQSDLEAMLAAAGAMSAAGPADDPVTVPAPREGS
jgi:glyoxylase-like metal-dependent hydrolase (beta-lactamase superfamily II)